MADSGPVIGIDLGTTYSCVAVVRGDVVEIIPSESGGHVLPSWVGFKQEPDQKVQRLVGDAAYDQAYKNPLNTIFGVKRFIGRSYKEFKNQENKIFFPYTVKEINNRPQISITTQSGEKNYAPEEISAIILAKLKERAEEYLKTSVYQAVITVPAHFNDAQRQATKVAGRIAGLEVLRLLNEPTAAAFAYELNNKYKNSRCNLLVYDFGGGTFDVSIVTLEEEIIEVLSTNGEAYLGGDDIDKNLTNHLMKDFKQKTGVDMSKDQRAVRRLQQQCEKAKRLLSSENSACIEVELICEGKDLSYDMTREEFNKLNKDIFQRTLNCVELSLSDANLTTDDINEIVLVGGSTRIPYIRNMVKDYFKKDLNESLNPDEAVAIGAARQGAILEGNELEKISGLLYDVCSLSLGMEVKGGLMNVLIPRNTKIPTKESKIYRTTRDNQTTIDIPVYEGERDLVKNNRLLGKFSLKGLIPEQKGKCNIKVNFEVNTDGILNVTAEDYEKSSKSYLTTHVAKGILSEDEIQRMIDDATKYKEEDAERKRCIKAKNDLENYIFDVLKVLKQIKIDNVDRKRIENKCEEIKEWMKIFNDIKAEDCYKKKDELSKISSVVINPHV